MAFIIHVDRPTERYSPSLSSLSLSLSLSHFRITFERGEKHPDVLESQRLAGLRAHKAPARGALNNVKKILMLTFVSLGKLGDTRRG